MNTYVDYAIMGSLIIYPLETDDFPEKLFISMFERKSNMEFDPFMAIPLCTRVSPSRHLSKVACSGEEGIWRDLYSVTISMIRLLQEEKVKDKIILYYRSNIKFFDFEVVCSAFLFKESAGLVRNGGL